MQTKKFTSIHYYWNKWQKLFLHSKHVNLPICISVCKSCLVRYLEEHNTCPKCGILIHQSHPMNYIRYFLFFHFQVKKFEKSVHYLQCSSVSSPNLHYWCIMKYWRGCTLQMCLAFILRLCDQVKWGRGIKPANAIQTVLVESCFTFSKL